eukprot:g35439.t1
MIEMYKIMRVIDRVDRKNLFALIERPMTRGHRFKVKSRKFRGDGKEKYLHPEVVGIWNSLPVKVGEAETLVALKYLDVLVEHYRLEPNNCARLTNMQFLPDGEVVGGCLFVGLQMVEEASPGSTDSIAEWALVGESFLFSGTVDFDFMMYSSLLDYVSPVILVCNHVLPVVDVNMEFLDSGPDIIFEVFILVIRGLICFGKAIQAALQIFCKPAIHAVNDLNSLGQILAREMEDVGNEDGEQG